MCRSWHRDALASEEVEVPLVLDLPASLSELLVDEHAGTRFRGKPLLLTRAHGAVRLSAESLRVWEILTVAVPETPPDLGRGRNVATQSSVVGAECQASGREPVDSRGAGKPETPPDLRIRSARRGVVLVGDTGFEPVTSSVSRKRATAAPIALVVRFFRGGYGI